MLKKFFSNFELVISAIILYILIAVSTASVLSRYFLPTPVTWSDELSRFLFMWLAMLSCPFAVAAGAQLCVDMVPTLLLKNFPKAKLALRLFCNVGFIIFAVALCVVGFEATVATKEISAAMKLPMTIVYSCIPLGSVLTCVRLVLDSIKAVRNFGKEEDEGPKSVLS